VSTLARRAAAPSRAVCKLNADEQLRVDRRRDHGRLSGEAAKQTVPALRMRGDGNRVTRARRVWPSGEIVVPTPELALMRERVASCLLQRWDGMLVANERLAAQR